MNFKKLFSLSIVLLLLLITGVVNAQYYVSNDPATGASNGRNGLAATKPTPDDGITGPKLTLSGVDGALASMVAGQTVTVASTGMNYTELGPIVINKRITLIKGAGAVTPNFSNATLQINVTQAAGTEVTMTGSFSFPDFDLTLGDIVSSGTLTISNSIVVNNTNANTSFTGTLVASTATLDYNAAYSSGNEWPTTGVTDLTTAAAVSMNNNHTITGDLTVGGGILNLTSDILTISGASLAHAVAFDVTNGTLAFSMTGATTISGTGAEDLPNITATDPAPGALLTVNNNIVDIGNISANGDADFLATNTGTIGTVTNNGSGFIHTLNDGTTLAVTVAGTGPVDIGIGAAGSIAVTGNVLVSGTGNLTFDQIIPAATDITVTGNVSITTLINISAAAHAGEALITFPDLPTTVTGTVTNSFDITGTSVVAGNNDNNGIILFQAADNNVALGNVINEATGNTAQDGSGAGDADDNGSIRFAFTGGTPSTFTAGNITNSSAFTADATNSGHIQFTGVWVDPITVGAVLNNSTSIAGSGIIDFNTLATGDFTATSLTTSGATAAGIGNNSIVLGNANNVAGAVTIDITGNVVNSRSVANSNITFTTGANDNGLTVTIGGAVTNNGASDIIFVFDNTTPDAVDITGVVTASGGGDVDFGDLTAGAFSASGLTASNGLIDLSGVDGTNVGQPNLLGGNVNVSGTGTVDMTGLNGGDAQLNSLTVSGGTLDLDSGAGDAVVVGGNISLTDGTIDFNATGAGGIAILSSSGTLITIGDADSNPTFLNEQDFPTVFDLNEPIPNQTQTVNIGNMFPQWDGDFSASNNANTLALVVRFTGGNMRIMGDLTFNTLNVQNSILLDGVKLYLGDNDVAASGGTFANTNGYQSENDGRVVMSGSQVQNVTFPAGTINFASFEVDNNSGGAPAVTFNGGGDGNNARMTGFYYLTEGAIEAQDVNLITNGDPVAPSVPHVVVNAGTFDANAVTFTSPYDVTYIGTEKTTSWELASLTMLRNLTIATSNHTAGLGQAGYGVIDLGAATVVHGTLTVRPQQTLFLNGFDITVMGSTVNVEGTVGTPATFAAIAGAAGDELILGNLTGGTTVNGPGYIPNVRVLNGSAGNIINSDVTGCIDELLGAADNNRNDAGVPDVTTADGDIAFDGGATASDLTVTFGGVGPHFRNLTTAALSTFIIGADQVMSGDIDHNSTGIVNLGGFQLTVGGSLFLGPNTATNNGTLLFVTDNEAITVDNTGTPATINANVTVDIPGAAVGQDDFTIGSNAEELIINGTFTLLDQTVGGPVTTGVDLNIANGEILTLAGNTVNISDGSTITTTGTGLLNLQPAAGTLAFSIPDINIANVEVDGNVDLLGNILGNTLTINNFTHRTGTFNFSTADIEVTNAYNRIAGDYTGTGWLIWNGATENNFNHGATNFSINNLSFLQDAEVEEAGVITVNTELLINNTDVILTAGKLLVGAGALVHVTEAGGGADVTTNPLTFAGNVNYLFDGAGNITVPVNIWPIAPAFMSAQNVEVGGTGNVILGADRYIGTMLELSNTGDFIWDDPLTLTLNDPAVIRRSNNGGLLLRNPDADLINGGFVNGVVNLEYQNAVNTAVEYTDVTTIGTFTLLTGGTNVTIDDAGETITGTVTMNSTLNVNASTTFSLLLNVPAASTVNVGALATATFTTGLDVRGQFTNAGTTTTPGTITIYGIAGNYHDNGGITTALNIVNNDEFDAEDASVLNISGNVSGSGTYDFNAAGVAANAVYAALNYTGTSLNFAGATLVNTNNLDVNFTGAAPVAFTLPAAAAVHDLTMNMTANTIVTLAGANVTVNGTLNLFRGVLDGTIFNIIVNLPFTALGNYNYLNAAAINRFVVAPAISHVIGRLAVMTPIAAVGRIDFPVGTALNYRPAAIEFTTAMATTNASTITVGHIDGEATGNVNLPLDGGTKWNVTPAQANRIGGKSNFSWTMSATPSLGVLQKYNLELQTENVNEPYDHVYNLRTIGRADGTDPANAWFIQGTNIGTNNILHVPTTTVTIRADNATGWLVPQATFYTIGIPTQAPVWMAGGQPADVIVNENDPAFIMDWNAQDLDALPTALKYSIESVVPALDPAVYSWDENTGVLTFTPNYTLGTQAYVFTVKAYKVAEPTSFITDAATITVNNSDQPSTWTTQTAAVTVATGATGIATNVAEDLDGDAIVYTQVADKAITGTVTINQLTGELSYSPTWADLALTPVTFTVTATSNNVINTNTVFTITSGRLRGDVRIAGVGGAIDNAVTSGDATRVLRMNVGLDAEPAAGTEDFWAADVNMSGAISPVDAAWILAYGVNDVYPDLSLPKIVSRGDVAFANANLSEGKLYNLPIVITNTANVTSAFFKLDIDNASADVKYVNSQLPEGSTLVYNYENGVLRIAIAGLKSFNEGTSINVGLELANKDSKLDVIGSAQLNDNAEIMLTKTSVKEIPTSFGLENNYPNPFNPTTVVKYQIATNEKVSLIVYDMLGRVVRTVVNELQEAGYYTATWNGTNDLGAKVSSGVYIYRLQAGSFVATKKMNLIK